VCNARPQDHASCCQQIRHEGMMLQAGSLIQ